MSEPRKQLPGFIKIGRRASERSKDERILLRVVGAQESTDRRIQQLIAAGLDPLEAIRIVQTDQAA